MRSKGKVSAVPPASLTARAAGGAVTSLQGSLGSADSQTETGVLGQTLRPEGQCCPAAGAASWRPRQTLLSPSLDSSAPWCPRRGGLSGTCRPCAPAGGGSGQRERTEGAPGAGTSTVATSQGAAVLWGEPRHSALRFPVGGRDGRTEDTGPT